MSVKRDASTVSDRALMSRRDTYWFNAGAASGLMVGALGVYFLVGSPAAQTAPSAITGSAAQTNSDILMPGDRWPTLADAEGTGALPSQAQNAGSATDTSGRSAGGSLETVTQNLAQRLATQGGTDDEWRLLAQSYEYMGRTNEARAARMHIGAKDTDAGNKTTTTSVESGNPPAGGATAGSRISGTVQIDAKLASLAAKGTTLFIYAMDPAAPGPPLAVLRLKVDRWPVSFVLDDADAMIPGRNLSAAKTIQLEARISTTGEALPHAGDLVGRLAAIDPNTQHPVNISIDRKIT
jgi:hypothetical protein